MQMATALTDYIKPCQRTNEAERKLRIAKLEYANDMLCKADILQERADEEREKALRMKYECRVMAVKYFIKSIAAYVHRKAKLINYMVGKISKKLSKLFKHN